MFSLPSEKCRERRVFARRTVVDSFHILVGAVMQRWKWKSITKFTTLRCCHDWNLLRKTRVGAQIQSRAVHMHCWRE